MHDDPLAELSFMADARRVRIIRPTRCWQSEAARLQSEIAPHTAERFRVLLGREDAEHFTDTSAEFVVLTLDGDLVAHLVNGGGIEDIRVEPPEREPIPDWLRGMIAGA